MLMKIIKLAESPELSEQAASWFAQKWGIAVEAYRDSIQLSIEQQEGIPQWYVMLDDRQHIIAGAGVIDNDFHDRKDLTPNLCALFVEQPYRNRQFARQLLDFARHDMKSYGYKKLYLITDLSLFYEKCGWAFLTLVEDDDGELIKMYVADTF